MQKFICQVCFILLILGVALQLSYFFSNWYGLIKYSQNLYLQKFVPKRRISTTTPTSNRTRNHQYMLVTKYSDQLTGALGGYTQLVGVSVALGRLPLVPFLYESYMYGIPATDDYVSLNEIYQFSEAERRLKQCIVQARPNFSILTFQEWALTVQSKDLTTLEFFLPEMRHGIKKDIVDCDQYNVKMQQTLNKSIENLNRYASKADPKMANRFTVVKRVCIFTLNVSLPALASLVSDDSTVVLHYQIYKVRPRFSKIETACLNKEKINYIMDTAKLRACCNSLTWPVSNRVQEAAESALLKLGLHKSYTAVHVRIERLIQHYQSPQRQQCIGKLKQVLTMLQTQGKSDINRAILVHDIGEMGSGTCSSRHEKCHTAAMEILAELKKIGLREFEYKPQENEIQDRGVAALVEREVEIGADILVAMGGGHFQESIRHHFLLKHSENSLHTVCL